MLSRREVGLGLADRGKGLRHGCVTNACARRWQALALIPLQHPTKVRAWWYFCGTLTPPSLKNIHDRPRCLPNFSGVLDDVQFRAIAAHLLYLPQPSIKSEAVGLQLHDVSGAAQALRLDATSV